MEPEYKVRMSGGSPMIVFEKGKVGKKYTRKVWSDGKIVYTEVKE